MGRVDLVIRLSGLFLIIHVSINIHVLIVLVLLVNVIVHLHAGDAPGRSLQRRDQRLPPVVLLLLRGHEEFVSSRPQTVQDCGAVVFVFS